MNLQFKWHRSKLFNGFRCGDYTIYSQAEMISATQALCKRYKELKEPIYGYKKVLKIEKDKLMLEPENNRDWELITAIDIVIGEKRFTKEELSKVMMDLHRDIYNNSGDSFVRVDGHEYYTDMGYAMDGIEFFMFLLKERLEKIKEDSDD